MPSALTVADISAVARQARVPDDDHLEPSRGSAAQPVSFDRALQAEVRDALWMLTKQWQMGEFRGSDAGSPVFAKLLMQTTRLTKYQPARRPSPSRSTRRCRSRRRSSAVPFRSIGKAASLSLDLRLVMARQWLALIAAMRATTGRLTSRPTRSRRLIRRRPATSTVCAHPEAWDTFQAVAGRAMDGGALVRIPASPTRRTTPTTASSASDGGDRARPASG